jgi:uncharacterized protein (TIGR02996 family)
MTPDDAFLADIIANADDDAPRLVYADWLEDHGQPDRAAFVRVQCQLARLPEDDALRPDTRREGLEAKERELLARHGPQWLGPLHSPLLHWKFRRGFPEGFAHAGLFQRTEAIEHDDGERDWSYLRFYADREAMFVTSGGTPDQVARWFRRGWRPNGIAVDPVGRYTLRWKAQSAELSFGITAGYGTGFGRLDFAGAIEVEQDLFNSGLFVRLVLDVYNHDEGRTTRQVYRLIDVPDLDSSKE